MSRFKGFSLNLLSTVCPNLTSPRRQDFPSVHVSHVISFHKRRGEVDALQYLFFKLIFCDCLVTNAVYTHQKTQQKREKIYIYITILNISNPAHPEITDVNTLVNSLCILYSYRQRYRLQIQIQLIDYSYRYVYKYRHSSVHIAICLLVALPHTTVEDVQADGTLLGGGAYFDS